MKPADFKIFFLCEDMAALDRAFKLKAALVNDWSGRGLIHASFYEFARLWHPHLMETATDDAAAADMLIVSSGGKNELPLFVQNWLVGLASREKKITHVFFLQPGLAMEAPANFGGAAQTKRVTRRFPTAWRSRLMTAAGTPSKNL